MKKTILMMAVAAAVLTAGADYLYYQLAWDTSNFRGELEEDSYARLYYVKAADFVPDSQSQGQEVDNTFATAWYNGSSAVPAEENSDYIKGITPLTDQDYALNDMFYIKIFDAQDQLLYDGAAYNNYQSLDWLMQENYVSGVGDSDPDKSWAAAGIPEPTGGLLALLGLAALALRRKESV